MCSGKGIKQGDLFVFGLKDEVRDFFVFERSCSGWGNNRGGSN